MKIISQKYKFLIFSGFSLAENLLEELGKDAIESVDRLKQELLDIIKPGTNSQQGQVKMTEANDVNEEANADKAKHQLNNNNESGSTLKAEVTTPEAKNKINIVLVIKSNLAFISKIHK